MFTVVTLGNPHRGDDGAGPAVAARLREAGVEVTEVEEPTRLVEILDGAGKTLIVDGVISGAPPGSVILLDVTATPLPGGVIASSHTVSLAQGLELARTLGVWPERVIVIGIEVKEIHPGSGLHPETSRAVAVAVELILSILAGRV